MQRTPPEAAGSFDFLVRNGLLAIWDGKQGNTGNCSKSDVARGRPGSANFRCDALINDSLACKLRFGGQVFYA